MPKRYAREFRCGVCERLVSGERIGKGGRNPVSHLRPFIGGGARPSSMLA